MGVIRLSFESNSSHVNQHRLPWQKWRSICGVLK